LIGALSGGQSIPAFNVASWGSAGNAFAGAAAGAAIGGAIGFLVGKAFGLQGDGLSAAVIAGFIAGGVLGIQAVTATGLFAGGSGGITSLLSFAFLFWVVVIVIIVAIIISVLGIGKTRETHVEFSCLPWQPPLGGSDCAKCGQDGLPCSKYKCQSLGQTCEFLNEGTDNELCIDTAPDDSSPPIINEDKDTIEEGFEYKNAQENIGVEIKSLNNGDGCIPEYTPVLFGIELNEPGQCKVEKVHTANYEEMSAFFGGSNLYRYNHDEIIAMPTLTSLGVPGIQGDPDRRGEYNLFVRCSDGSGNSNVKEYVVNFCVSPAQDVTPPIITEFIPESPGYAGVYLNEKFVQFHTNEPADCRWSLQDKAYEVMENEILCYNQIEDVTLNGWLCSVNLPVETEDETNYYFRCADQPWLEHDNDDSNDGESNVNSESVVFQIIKTTTPLEIVFVSPDGEKIFAAGEPVSVDIEIHTSGGVDNTAFCEFSFDSSGEGIFTDFLFTGGEIHKQTFSTLFEGDYSLALMCVDKAENVATENAEFSVEVDNQGPFITRVYNQNGILNVITNEPSECAFAHESCGFNFDSDEAELMTGTKLIHTTSFDNGLTYYLKCQDSFGNTGNCLVVSGGY
jgi:hypothetical protein